MNTTRPVDPEARGNEMSMKDPPGSGGPGCVTFGSAAVYPRRRELRVDGEPVEINNCAFEILLMLIEADGMIVSKKELFQRLWPKTCVSENNLRVNMYKLRRALGDNATAIKTAPNRGYMLTAPVALSADNRPGAAAASREAEEAMSCRRARAATLVVNVDEDEGVRTALDTLLRSVRRAIERHPQFRENTSAGIAPDCLILDLTFAGCRNFREALDVLPRSFGLRVENKSQHLTGNHRRRG
jgi:DNA-binding winged helix-turn-helix (wHTH) protein